MSDLQLALAVLGLFLVLLGIALCTIVKQDHDQLQELLKDLDDHLPNRGTNGAKH